MKNFEVRLPDEVVTALEDMFTPEMVPLIVNQAVLREIEEFCHRHGITYTPYIPGQDPHSRVPNDEDTNCHEWTS